MDVRAVDTSNMAAKRTELEHDPPLKNKGAFVIGRVTSRTSQEAGGQVGRSKSSTEQEHGQGREHAGRQPAENCPEPEGQATDPPDAPPEDMEHHLDVKV